MEYRLTRESVIEFIEIVAGNVILAAGYGVFAVPANILSGGLAGLAIALKPLIPWINTEVFVTLATYGLFFIGWFALGKKFAFTTFLSSIIFPPLLSFFIHHFPRIPMNNELVFSFYSGILVGVGCGLVFKAGSSTGGLDIPPLIANKYFNIKLNTAVAICDGSVIALGFLTRGVYPGLIGLIAVFTCSFVIEKTMLIGTQSSMQIMIISDHTDEIEKEIIKTMNRGVTRIKTEGVYHNIARNMLMVVISKKQYPKLVKIVAGYDEHAFMTVSDVKDVFGLGFSYHRDNSI
ncbi:MAG: YitT family protein [Erysipelotrichaceae bacterium]|nr:YitT family protein [Erysipelotrichaceae bacterium]